MSRNTFVCRQCSAVRRREPPQISVDDAFPPPGWPHCCETAMVLLQKVYAEAATKVTRVERLEWLRCGMHVFRLLGRRWMPALSATEVRRSKDQGGCVSGAPL
jgi:hypothetical protein